MFTTRKIVAVAAAGLALVLLASACGSKSSSSSSTTTAAATAGIEITDAWCRTSPSMAEAGACYLTIMNGSSTADALTAVSVPADVAATAELHETTMSSGDTGTTMGGSMGSSMGTSMSTEMSTDTTTGMMEMKPVSSIPVPANGSVELKPGGYHVMLMQLKNPLTTGGTVPLTLTFEKAGTKQVTAEVRAS